MSFLWSGAETTLENGVVVRSWPVPPLRAYQGRGGDVLVVRLYDQRREPIKRR